MTSTPDGFREWDAAYVLGALSSEDRHDFERHLQTCPACSVAVAELAGLPGILSALPAAEAAAITQPRPADGAPDRRGDEEHQSARVQTLARAAVQRTRRGRIRLAVALSAAAAVIAVGGGMLGATLATPSAPLTAATPSPPAGEADAPSAGPTALVVAMEPLEPDALTAALTITSTEWGTRFDWSCVYLNQLWKDNGPQGYDMVMTDSAGTSTVLATWTATSPSTENLAASTDLPTDRIVSVEIRASRSGTPLAHSDL
jgi:hypothetical protein